MTKREASVASQAGKPKPKIYRRRAATMAERRALSASAGGTIDSHMKQPGEAKA
jgi:hypothetical protein